MSRTERTGPPYGARIARSRVMSLGRRPLLRSGPHPVSKTHLSPAETSQDFDDAPATPEPAAVIGMQLETSPEVPKSARHPVEIMKRAASLGSDAVVLALAAPFFAVWFTYRTLKRWTSAR